MSGSMDNPAAHSNRIEATGKSYTSRGSTYYGFQNDYEDFTFYIKDGDSYIELEYVNTDRNGFEYYSAGGTNYYPILNVSATNRRNNYEVKQFYRNMSHMESLKHSASAFITDIAEKNAALTNDADKHRVSIVKFAMNDYYNGSSATDDYTQSVIGNNLNSNNYNYTQVVVNLTTVDTAGQAALTNALNNLQAGGATAVDYGIALANKVLSDRNAADATDRTAAAIVFTDGSPTYANSYQASVAGDAINNALALKQDGVKIFSIGSADTADSTIFGDESNRFMHYISNNFPNASYAGGTITPGEGSIDNGFYMTPSDDKNLDSLFDDIFKQTVELDIAMGASAGVIDTVSTYFTLPSEPNSVTLQIAEKTASGWDAPQPADGVTPIITGNTLTVRGFDFDANHVSETPRDVGGAPFYGKKLIITVNAEPDYTFIDLHKASIVDGKMPTNEGNAAVVNSASEPVATKAPPIVTAKKVIYKVDGEEYDYFYRFAGASVDPTTLLSTTPTKEGHIFSGWDRTDVFTMPNADVIINGYFTANSHTVTYEFDGVQPHGVTVTIPDSYNHTAAYGTTVDIKDDLAQDGYTFTGWYSEDPAIAEDDASFTMPTKAVVLKGKFTARDDTAYTARYHLQKLNAAETAVAGTNKETDYEIVETIDATGTTGHSVTAEVKHYDGFTARTDNVINATIAGDGTTVIDLYYDRVVNPIEYHFYGEAPDHTTAELPATEENVPYGAKRSVAAKITCDPSHRHEPTDWSSPHVTPANGEFTMPATKVDFYTAVRHIYKVEYDLDGGKGATSVIYTPYDVFASTVIEVKPAPTKTHYTFTGWKLNGTDTIYNPDDEIVVNQDIKLIAQYTFNGTGGGSISRYALTYESNGGTEYAKESYTSGKIVALDKVPTKEGYLFDGWHTDAALKKDATRVTMNKNTTVYAAWIKDESHETPDALNDHDHFAYVVGYPDGTVRPNNNITRAEAVSIFFRLLEDDVRAKNIATTNVYEDVNAGDWHNLPISTMLQLGIASGRSETHFEPDAYITRAELAVLCARFDDSEFEVIDNFTDVEGHWAESEIHEAAANGWIKGYEDDTFRPDEFITRAEAMTLINRVLNRVPEKPEDLLDGMIVWPDNMDTSEWYYLPVQEATNDHEHTMKNNVYKQWTKLVDITDWMEYHK